MGGCGLRRPEGLKGSFFCIGANNITVHSTKKARAERPRWPCF